MALYLSQWCANITLLYVYQLLSKRVVKAVASYIPSTYVHIREKSSLLPFCCYCCSRQATEILFNQACHDDSKDFSIIGILAPSLSALLTPRALCVLYLFTPVVHEMAISSHSSISLQMLILDWYMNTSAEQVLWKKVLQVTCGMYIRL